MKTKNGIELDLKNSSYIYNYNNLKFYFSSELYLKKFQENLSYYIFMETTKIINKYKVKINLNLYLAISFYQKIEKRGFYIKYGNEEIEIPKFEVDLI